MLSLAVRHALHLIYVPNSMSNSVDEIDPRTFKVVRHFAVGVRPQHVVPAYDLKMLYVLNNHSNTITPIDPLTGNPGRPIPVADPYNMYFTPNGRYAIVVAEALDRLDFREPHTFALQHSLPVPCTGVNHMDFSRDGSIAVASCEFSGTLLKIDVRHPAVLAKLLLPRVHAAKPQRQTPKPQDVKLSPDGKIYYVADGHANGIWEISAAGRGLKIVGFLPTGRGAHGLYPSRNAHSLYVTNRLAGTISVVNFRTRKITSTFHIPGGSPDMGGVSASGHTIWVAGRYNAQVYAIDTLTGKLLARIPVGKSPHGLCVWPQPGRYSLGHTGVMR